MTSTATFEICISSRPIARNFHPEDIELGMSADAGVYSEATKDSAYITVRVPAVFAKDAADWLEQSGLI